MVEGRGKWSPVQHDDLNQKMPGPAQQALRGVGLAYITIGVTFFTTAIFGVERAILRVTLGVFGLLFIGWGAAHWTVTLVQSSESHFERSFQDVSSLIAAEGVLAALGSAIGVMLIASDAMLDPARGKWWKFVAGAILVATAITAYGFARHATKPQKVWQLLNTTVGPMIFYRDSRIDFLRHIESTLDSWNSRLETIDADRAALERGLVGALNARIDAEAQELLWQAIRSHARLVGGVWNLGDAHLSIVRGHPSHPLDALSKRRPVGSTPLIALPIFALTKSIVDGFHLGYAQRAINSYIQHTFGRSVANESKMMEGSPFDHKDRPFLQPPGDVVSRLMFIRANSHGPSALTAMKDALAEWYRPQDEYEGQLRSWIESDRQRIATLWRTWGMVE
jgi:hypothetical protein